MPLDRITRKEVMAWFDHYSRTAPGGANHALDTLGQILNHAKVHGHRWSEVGADTLDLADSKTGPRKVYLNSKASRIIARQPRKGSDHVFPSPCDPTVPTSSVRQLWYTLRKRVGIEDVRLHDLRHNFASQAVLNGVPLPTVARLLGHRQVSMTLRYAHVADRDVETAAERVGNAITQIMTSGVAS